MEVDDLNKIIEDLGICKKYNLQENDKEDLIKAMKKCMVYDRITIQKGIDGEEVLISENYYKLIKD